MCSFLVWPKKVAKAGLLGLTFLASIAAPAQDAGQATSQDTVANQQPLDVNLKAIPILTGSGAYFTKVTAGQFQNIPSISPLLLVPVGDRLLLEGKGSYSETFTKDPDDTYFENKASYGLAYAQADYITKYVTFTAGRFITPFNIYGERFAPNWIKALQVGPLTSPLASGAALGGMVRGGFSATDKINLNYAFYFSANNTHHLLATDRSTGGRVGFFIPGPRLELGISYQQVLQADRAHAAGGYFLWQPNRVPLSLRSEFVRSSGIKGKAYWIESAYRLSQISALRRLELVGRGEQFFTADNLSAATIKKLGTLGKNTQEGDFGLNYYFRTDVRASASYGRQFVQGVNANLWTIGMTYRFVVPLGPSGNRL
jgi:hypothetical protein